MHGNFRPLMDTNFRVTKSMIEYSLASFLRVPKDALNFVKIDDNPNQWKHACYFTGVTALVPRKIFLDTVWVYFAVCPACKKVIYHYDD